MILSIRLAVPAPLAYTSFTLLSRPILMVGSFLKADRSTFTFCQLMGVPENDGRYVGPTCVPFTVTRKLVLALVNLNNCFRSKVRIRESVTSPPAGEIQK